MNPLINTLPLLYSLLLFLILISPISIKIKIPIFVLAVVIYNKQLLLTLHISFLVLTALITKNNIYARTLGNLIVYQHLKCQTIIPAYKKPCIYVVNYPLNILEFCFISFFPSNVLLIADSNQQLSSLVIDKDKIITINRKHKNNFNILTDKINTASDKGLSVMAYVSTAVDMKSVYDIPKIHRGIFGISKKINIPIVPILFDRINLSATGKILNTKFDIKIGKIHIVKNIDTSIKYVQKFFTKLNT
jgi:hypothetical protein